MKPLAVAAEDTTRPGRLANVDSRRGLDAALSPPAVTAMTVYV